MNIKTNKTLFGFSAITIIAITFLLAWTFYACSSGSSSKNTQDNEDDNSPVLNDCIGFLTAATEEISRVSEAGAAWTRPHPGPFVWDYVETAQDNFSYSSSDEWVTEAQDNHISIVGTIWPYASWDQETCHGSECEVTTEDQFYPSEKNDNIPVSRCAPCSLDDYQDFLINLVERYDGDGVDDMSGLTTPIKYWEILNEIEFETDDLTFYIGTKEKYLEILRTSYETIKEACSDCFVLQAGIANDNDESIDYWEDLLDLGAASYFDIGNIHYINSGNVDNLNAGALKSLFEDKNISKPIWVTEAQLASEDEVVDAFEGALASGATKVLFTDFVIGENNLNSSGYSKVYDDLVDLCDE